MNRTQDFFYLSEPLDEADNFRCWLAALEALPDFVAQGYEMLPEADLYAFHYRPLGKTFRLRFDWGYGLFGQADGWTPAERQALVAVLKRLPVGNPGNSQ